MCSRTDWPSGDNEGVTPSTSDLWPLSVSLGKRNLSNLFRRREAEGRDSTSGALNSWILSLWCQMFPCASGGKSARSGAGGGRRGVGGFILISDKPRMRLGWNITSCRCLCTAQDGEALKRVIKTTWCYSSRSRWVHLQTSHTVVQLEEKNFNDPIIVCVLTTVHSNVYILEISLKSFRWVDA